MDKLADWTWINRCVADIKFSGPVLMIAHGYAAHLGGTEKIESPRLWRPMNRAIVDCSDQSATMTESLVPCTSKFVD